MILRGSRYHSGTIVSDSGPSVVSAPDTPPRIGVLRGQVPLGTKFLHYEVVIYDRLDTLAYRFYGDASLWWLIADANPQIQFPEPLIPGSIVRIPQA